MSDLNKYFNFIVIGDEESWITEQHEQVLWGSRFMEYTTEEIREKFKEDKSFLNFPCVCTYEGSESKIYLAQIDDFQVQGRDIRFSLKDLKEQNVTAYDFFNNNQNIIQEWELQRQHWAIKKGDVNSILENILNSNKDNRVVKIETIGFDSCNIGKPSISCEEEIEISNIQDLISKLIKSSDGKTTFYRGHSNKKYKLEPSLFRSDDNGFYHYKEREDIIYRELLTLNYAEFSNDDSTFDRLVHMQHFSLPTRLLDITSNPLIALYFACKSHENEDGDLISIQIDNKDIKYFDSDTVACIANLCKLSFSEKEKINVNNKDDELTKKHIHYIKDDKPYFENRICDNDIRKVICVKGKSNNPRIYAQSGAFLLFGLDARLDDKNNFNFKIMHYIIKAENKGLILKQLDLLNINESTVFPYLENSAKYISQKFKKTSAITKYNWDNNF